MLIQPSLNYAHDHMKSGQDGQLQPHNVIWTIRFTRMETFLPGFNFYLFQHMTTSSLRRRNPCWLTRLWTTQLYKDGHFSTRFKLLLNWAYHHNKSWKDGHLHSHKAMGDCTSHFSARFQLLLISAHDHNIFQKDGHLQVHKAMDNPDSQGWTLSFQVSTFTE